MQHYTTIEQSKKLVNLGLNPGSADMCYIQHFDESYNEVTFIEEDPILTYTIDTIDLPCWSLGTLLELMPKVISIPVDERSSYFYRLEWQFANDNSLRYITTNRGRCLIDIHSDSDVKGKSFIETAYEMVCWLLEKGYIKKGE